jgi:hypothetical protein
MHESKVEARVGQRQQAGHRGAIGGSDVDEDGILDEAQRRQDEVRMDIEAAATALVGEDRDDARRARVAGRRRSPQPVLGTAILLRGLGGRGRAGGGRDAVGVDQGPDGRAAAGSWGRRRGIRASRRRGLIRNSRRESDFGFRARLRPALRRPVEEGGDEVRGRDLGRGLLPALQLQAGHRLLVMLDILAVPRVETVEEVELAQLALADLGAPDPAPLAIPQDDGDDGRLARAHHGALEMVRPVDRPIERARGGCQLGERIVEFVVLAAVAEDAQDPAGNDPDEVKHGVPDRQDVRLGVLSEIPLRLPDTGLRHVVVRVPLTPGAALVGRADDLLADRAVLRLDLPGGADLQEAGLGRGIAGTMDHERQVSLDEAAFRRHPVIGGAAGLVHQDSERRRATLCEPAVARGLGKKAELPQAVAGRGPVDRRLRREPAGLLFRGGGRRGQRAAGLAGSQQPERRGHDRHVPQPCAREPHRHGAIR